MDTPLALAVVDQVMRCTADLGAAADVLGTPERTPAAVALAGRLVAEHAVPLAPGAPLTVWARGGSLDPNWQAWCPPRPGSAAAELADLEQVYGPGDGSDPLTRLLDLRARFASDVA
jgi:hypothetical protein